MRDLRNTVLASTTISTTDVATNGTTIDLKSGYTGDYFEGAEPEHGLGVICMASAVVSGTGDGFTITWKWQTSPNDSTWTDGPTIGVMTVDTTGLFLIEGATVGTYDTAGPLTRQKLTSKIVTSKRYVRVVATTLGMTNSEVVVLQAWLGDGALSPADNGKVS